MSYVVHALRHNTEFRPEFVCGGSTGNGSFVSIEALPSVGERACKLCLRGTNKDLLLAEALVLLEGAAEDLALEVSPENDRVLAIAAFLDRARP